MPDYLTSNRKTIASILWIPFSWLVQALVYALVAMIFVGVFRSKTSFAPETALLIIGLLPIAGVIGAAIAAALVIRDYRGQGRSDIGLFLRGFFWFFSFPARGWLIGFGWTVRFMLTFAVAVIIGFIGLLITWWAVSTLITMGANGWVIVLVGIVLPLLTVGGAAWGNQYGSGTTGGMPIGCVLAVALGIMGGFLWFCLLLVVLALFALPASLVLFSFHGGTFSSMSWEFYQWAVALGVFLVMVLPPFLVENSSQEARSRLLGKIPFVAERHRKRQAAEAHFAQLQRRAAAERHREQVREAREDERRIRWEREAAQNARDKERMLEQMRRTLGSSELPRDENRES